MQIRNSKEFQYQILEGTEILMKNNKIYVPKTLRGSVLDWYHYYLCHPGATRISKTIHQTMTWPWIELDTQNHVRTCQICQKYKKTTVKYGHFPEKQEECVPWKVLFVDLLVPYTVTVDKKDTTLHEMTFPSSKCNNTDCVKICGL